MFAKVSAIALASKRDRRVVVVDFVRRAVDRR
jgi:hypothetical protein